MMSAFSMPESAMLRSKILKIYLKIKGINFI